MKGYFTKEGKYKSYDKVVVASKEDVKKKKIFDIFDKNAQEFNEVGSFVYEGQKPKDPEPKPEPKKEVKKK
jgi:hypothetical protein